MPQHCLPGLVLELQRSIGPCIISVISVSPLRMSHIHWETLNGVGCQCGRN